MMPSDSPLVAFGIGIAFGVALERAGLAHAPTLAGQFYFTDFTVFKVMFSALVTAMLGAFWLSRLGVIELAAVHVPQTWLLPQVVGGLVFGLGFVVSGLCPGTGCAAAASGRLDGLSTVLGMFVGVLATGWAYPMLEPFLVRTAYGPLTLPQALGVPYGVVVCGVVVVALGAFRLVEWQERRT